MKIFCYQSPSWGSNLRINLIHRLDLTWMNYLFIQSDLALDLDSKCLEFPYKIVNFHSILSTVNLSSAWKYKIAWLPIHFVTITKAWITSHNVCLFFRGSVFNATFFLCTIHKDQRRFMWFHVTNYSPRHDWALAANAKAFTRWLKLNRNLFIYYHKRFLLLVEFFTRRLMEGKASCNDN